MLGWLSISTETSIRLPWQVPWTKASALSSGLQVCGRYVRPQQNGVPKNKTQNPDVRFPQETISLPHTRDWRESSVHPCQELLQLFLARLETSDVCQPMKHFSSNIRENLHAKRGVKVLHDVFMLLAFVLPHLMESLANHGYLAGGMNYTCKSHEARANTSRHS